MPDMAAKSASGGFWRRSAALWAKEQASPRGQDPCSVIYKT
jgi:hypothetical protein